MRADRGRRIRAADGALGQRHGEAALAAVVGRAEELLAGRRRPGNAAASRSAARSTGAGAPPTKPSSSAQSAEPPSAPVGVAEEEDGVALLRKKLLTRQSSRLEQAHHADGRRRVDGAGRVLIVERDVAAGDRRAEREAGIGDAAARLAKLEEHLGLLRVAEVEAVRDAQWDARRCRRCCALPRPPSPCRPRRGREPRSRPLQSTVTAMPKSGAGHLRDAGIAARAERRGCLDRRVVLLVHPALARDGRRVEQCAAGRPRCWRRLARGGAAARRAMAASASRASG